MTKTSVYNPNSVADYQAAEAWLGRPLDAIQVFVGMASWWDWINSVNWQAGLFKDQPVDIMWSIPLFPWGSNLADAAAGKYDDKYLAMAKQMVANAGSHDSEIYVRLGWEFNTNGWNPWGAVGQGANYAEAFRHFVDIARSVSDKFVFEWTPNAGDFGMNPADAYPGDNYVDVIGIDFYHNVQWDSKDAKVAFNWFVKESYGLQWQQDFAAAHGKPTAIAEWGLNYDSPEFVKLVADWATSHNMLYQSYWNSNAAFQGSLSDGQYPNAAAAFKAIFGSQSYTGPVEIHTTPVVETPVTTTPETPASEPPQVTLPGVPSAITPPLSHVGTDTAVTTAIANSIATLADARLLRTGTDSYLITPGKVEHLDPSQIDTALGEHLAGMSGASIRTASLLEYIASYEDLRLSLGFDTSAASAQFQNFGAQEGRTVTFDGLEYIASYADLRAAFGADADKGAWHYIGWGQGRSITFDSLAYIASYADLRVSFGTDAHAGAVHYITTGANEGRTVTFNSLDYIASYSDLITAFGTDADAGAIHYITQGAAEGRDVSFDARQYGAGYADLAIAYHDDATALAKHYIEFGYAEGRSANPGFDAVGYLLGNPDLAAARLGKDGALHHWLAYGAGDGYHHGDEVFGREQTSHALTTSASVAAAFDTAGDHDWFEFDGTTGHQITIDYHSSISDAVLELHYSDGSLAAATTVAGSGHDATLTFIPNLSDHYYLAVSAASPTAIGSYSLDYSVL